MEQNPETNNQVENQTENPETTQAEQNQATPEKDVCPEIALVPPAPPEPPTPQNTLTATHTNHNYSQTKQHHKHALSAVIIIVLLTTSIVSAASIYSVYTLNMQVTSLQDEIQTLAAQVQSSSSGTTSASYASSNSLATLYSQVEDSVVTIECTIVQYYNTPFSRQQQSITSTAQGSGFVTQYNGQYIIITNNHVIEDASSITVTFADGNTYTATLIAADSTNDLAILTCNAPTSEYSPLEIISSQTISVGDAVIAIGSPYGLSGTMTTGIISALDRTITVTDDSTSGTLDITGIIQTSAPINSGNSGGPLLNYDGKVIGITTAIVSDSDGLGFAVPSDTILSFIQETL